MQDQRGELGVSEVLEVISKGASQWSSDRLRVSYLQLLMDSAKAFDCGVYYAFEIEYLISTKIFFVLA